MKKLITLAIIAMLLFSCGAGSCRKMKKYRKYSNIENETKFKNEIQKDCKQLTNQA